MYEQLQAQDTCEEADRLSMRTGHAEAGFLGFFRSRLSDDTFQCLADDRFDHYAQDVVGRDDRVRSHDEYY